jgi:hypothetical protein
MPHQPQRAGSIAIALALALLIVLPGDVLAITWGPNRQLTNTVIDGVDSRACRGGLAATSIDVVHTGYDTTNFVSNPIDAGVWYRRSLNGGATWGSPVRIATGGYCLGLTGSGQAINVLWRNDSLWLRHSSDGGTSWGDPVELAVPNAGLPVGDGRIAQFGSRLAVTWVDPSTGAVYLRRSGDGGATWDAPKYLWLSAQAGNPAPIPSYATGSLYLLYGGTGGRLRIRRSPDYGTTWPAGVTVAPSGGVDAIASAGSTVIVAYGSYVRRSTDKGAHWSAATKLGDKASRAVLAYRNGRFMAIYYRPGPPELFGAVWYRASTTNGRSWTSPTKVSSPSMGRNFPADADIARKTLVLYSASVEEWFDVFVRQSR